MPPPDPVPDPVPDPDPDPTGGGGGGGGGGGDTGGTRTGHGIGPFLTQEQRQQRQCSYFTPSEPSSSYLSDSSAILAAHDAAEAACISYWSANGMSADDAHTTCTTLPHSGDPYTWSCYTSWGASVCTVTIDRCLR
jgi:hypothetical protein